MGNSVPQVGRKKVSLADSVAHSANGRLLSASMSEWEIGNVLHIYKHALSLLKIDQSQVVDTTISRMQFYNIFCVADVRVFLSPKFKPLPIATFGVFDALGEGRVPVVELFMSLALHCEGGIRERTNFVFNLFDVDDGGTIDPAELTVFLGHFTTVFYLTGLIDAPVRGVPLKTLTKAMIKDMDTDKSGDIDADEFYVWVSSSMHSKKLLDSIRSAKHMDKKRADEERRRELLARIRSRQNKWGDQGSTVTHMQPWSYGFMNPEQKERKRNALVGAELRKELHRIETRDKMPPPIEEWVAHEKKANEAEAARKSIIAKRNADLEAQAAADAELKERYGASREWRKKREQKGTAPVRLAHQARVDFGGGPVSTTVKLLELPRPTVPVEPVMFGSDLPSPPRPSRSPSSRRRPYSAPATKPRKGGVSSRMHGATMNSEHLSLLKQFKAPKESLVEGIQDASRVDGRKALVPTHGWRTLEVNPYLSRTKEFRYFKDASNPFDVTLAPSIRDAANIAGAPLGAIPSWATVIPRHLPLSPK